MKFRNITQGCFVSGAMWLLAMPGCDSGTSTPSTPAAAVETIADFAGAPTETVAGAWACAGKAQGTATGGSIELNGYVRLLSDPDAKQPVPAATIEAFTADGASLAKSGADPSKAGRVSLSVAVMPTGFDGYAVISHDGFLDVRLQSSRKVVSTDMAGWAWLATQAEVDSRAKGIGIPLEAGKGLLVGAVHDCDGFGAANAVVVVGGKLENAVLYAEGFDLVGARTFAADSGRFAVANLPAGPVTVKAYGRTKAGGKLQLLSKIDTTVVPGKMTAIDLAPRAAGQ